MIRVGTMVAVIAIGGLAACTSDDPSADDTPAVSSTAEAGSGGDDSPTPATSLPSPNATDRATDTDDDAEVDVATSEPPPEVRAPTLTAPVDDDQSADLESAGGPPDQQPEVLGPLGASELDVETEGGSVQIGRGEIPGVVADDFPVPDDFVVQLSTSAGTDAGFSGVSQQPFADLVELYATHLPGLGFDVSEEQLIDGRVAVFAFERPDGSGSVAISSAPGGGWSILVTYES